MNYRKYSEVWRKVNHHGTRIMHANIKRGYLPIESIWDSHHSRTSMEFIGITSVLTRVDDNKGVKLFETMDFLWPLFCLELIKQ